MNQLSIQPERIKKLNGQNIISGDYVLYWMQASQRTHYNHALEYAIHQANKLKKPLVVYFGLTANYPQANQRHYFFLLEGLREVERDLNDMKVQLVVLNQSPERGVVEMAENASIVITDRGYLDIQRICFVVQSVFTGPPFHRTIGFTERPGYWYTCMGGGYIGAKPGFVWRNAFIEYGYRFLYASGQVLRKIYLQGVITRPGEIYFGRLEKDTVNLQAINKVKGNAGGIAGNFKGGRNDSFNK
jgi:hypothetical protein